MKPGFEKACRWRATRHRRQEIKTAEEMRLAPWVRVAGQNEECMYTWIENTFGVGDGLARGLAFAVSLAVVLALFALFVFIVKRLAGSRISSVRSRQPRLAIMDTASVDTRRRLVLVRRDNVEHLLMIGGPSDVVVEQGIVRGTPVAATHPRPQPILQAVGGQLQNGEAANPVDLAPAQMVATASAPQAPEPPAPAEPATAPVVQMAQAPAQAAAGAAEKPDPAPSKSVSSLRARLAELKKSPNPFADKNAANPQDPVAIPQPAQDRVETRPAQAVRNDSVKPPRPHATGTGAPAGAPHDKAGMAAGQPRIPARPLQSRMSASPPERKVTPPSSGPAANARTVVRPDTHREPVVGGAMAASSAAPATAPSVEVQSADVTPAAAPQPAKPQAASPATDATAAKPATPAAPAVTASEDAAPVAQENKSGDPAPSPAAPEPGQATTPATAAGTRNGSVGNGAPSAATPPSEAQNTAPDPAPGRDAGTDKTAPETEKAAQGNGADTKSDNAESTNDAEQAGDKPQSAPETPAQPADKQAATEQTDPSAEANPIEDEMAKLLDEIHGTQKT
jgi:flagellar protein FliO/FliZ